jgi:hypothetical protein
MSEFDDRRIAMVLAQPPGGGAEGQAYGEVATGYFLTGDLVLTARHVADLPDRSFWVRAEVDGPESESWAKAFPAWTGRDVDAMLLRTSRSFGSWKVPEFPEITKGSWQSSGYAKAAEDKKAHNRKTLPVDGSFDVSRGQGPPELRLKTDLSITKENEHHWKGISGAPIFSKEKGGGLVGIITDASSSFSNNLVGLSVTRLLEDIDFRTAIAPSFLPPRPPSPWCLVLMAESSRPDLKGKVEDALTGFQGEDSTFPTMHKDAVVISALDAVSSVEHWAETVEALAQADFVVADVSNFEPAVMALLGVRSVLRRGVTISVKRGDLKDPVAVPFNVQETRVLSYDDNFYDNLQGAIVEGSDSRDKDSNYLDLPAYHAVRAPRPETWANDDPKTVLVLCPFSDDYREYYEKTLREIIRGNTMNRKPQRMLDLRSPRLVGQALYEQIRWSSRCIVDWTGWRPNVFFELGVRLACSEHDPMCIIDRSALTKEVPSVGELQQCARLRALFGPVEYDKGDPYTALKAVLQSWVVTPQGSGRTAPSHQTLPPAGTFTVAQASFLWTQEALLQLPHREQRQAAVRMLGRDQERNPEQLTLFGGNQDFTAELEAAVTEKWIAAWLYLRHLSSEEPCPEDVHAELRKFSRLAKRALDQSRNRSQSLKQPPNARHERLLKEIEDLLNSGKVEPQTSGNGG